MRFLLLAVLFVPTSSGSWDPGVKYCSEYSYYERSNTIETDENNRITIFKRFLTYESLDSGVPLTEEVEQHVRDRESCEDNDVIGLLADVALGGSGNDTGNAIPFNTASHVIWKHKVTEPVYNFVRENHELNVMFEVQLFYDDDNTTRPFFLGVRHKYCRDRYTDWGYPDSDVEEYVVKGFLPNPPTAETVVPYLYKTRLAKVDEINMEWSSWDERTAIPLDHYNETMEKMHRERLGNAVVHNEDGDHITRLEGSQYIIDFEDLYWYTTYYNCYNRGWRWLRRKFRLHHSESSKYIYDTQIQANPKAREEVENSIMPYTIEYFNDTSNFDNEVIVRMNILYKDNLTLTPSGFLLSASIRVKRLFETLKTISCCLEIPTQRLIYNEGELQDNSTNYFNEQGPILECIRDL